jgi:non-canonical purine NTP pyrophosphatase (RdgB/HAM1 family)
MNTKLTFITGNENKAREVQQILEMSVEHIRLDVDELQTLDLEKISEHKAQQAYAIIKKPLIVEDTGMVFHALGKLPGPFIKFFNNEIKPENFPKLLTGYQDKTATISVVFAYHDEKNIHLFQSEIHGHLADAARGENGFEFDKVFIPDGYTKTLAEMTADEKNAISHRGQAARKLKHYLQNTLQ